MSAHTHTHTHTALPHYLIVTAYRSTARPSCAAPLMAGVRLLCWDCPLRAERVCDLQDAIERHKERLKQWKPVNTKLDYLRQVEAALAREDSSTAVEEERSWVASEIARLRAYLENYWLGAPARQAPIPSLLLRLRLLLMLLCVRVRVRQQQGRSKRRPTVVEIRGPPVTITDTSGPTASHVTIHTRHRTSCNRGPPTDPSCSRGPPTEPLNTTTGRHDDSRTAGADRRAAGCVSSPRRSR